MVLYRRIQKFNKKLFFLYKNSRHKISVLLLSDELQDEA